MLGLQYIKGAWDVMKRMMGVEPPTCQKGSFSDHRVFLCPLGESRGRKEDDESGNETGKDIRL